MTKQNVNAAYAVAKINNIDLIVIEQDGTKMVPITPICDILGVVSNAQIEKITKHPILSSTHRVTRSVGADGKDREMFCIPLKFVFGWLFTIHPDRVSPDARDAVIKYHLDCYDALYEHFSSYYDYVEYRNKLVEERLEFMEQVREEFRTAKDKLEEAKVGY